MNIPSNGNEENEVKEKKLCPFKEKCYRINPIHFEDMSHPHLEKLLSEQLNGPIVIPSNLDFECQDKSQLMNQLKILQKVLSRSKGKGINNEKCNVIDSEISQKCKQKRLLEPSTSNSKQSTHKKSKEKTPPNTNKTQHEKKSPDRQQGTSIFEKFSASKTIAARLEVRNHALEKLKQAAHKIPYLTKIGEFDTKYALSSPYNIFLPCVQNEKETYKQPYSITFPEILDISLGEIIESLHINFMVDVGWLCLQYLFAGQKSNSLILLGERVDESPLPPTMKVITIKPPSTFGTHHSKISVLKYSNGGVRIIISTANLYMDDWENRSQALWMSPHLPPLSVNADKIEGESRTGFKSDFIEYMKQYNNAQMQYWVKIFERLDFSEIDIFFIASVPGTYKGATQDRWGLRKLRRLLTDHVELPSDRSNWPIVAQASSIGSLGPDFNSWLTQEFIPAMSGEKSCGIRSLPNFRFIYPSINNYKNSFDMQVGSCCLPYSRKTHSKQLWLQKYLYQWKSTTKCRDRAMPHSKIYTRISPDSKQIPWMLLTSGNLSKAAWGHGKTSWTILNYEAGVLFLPQFLTNSSTFPICKSNGDNNTQLIPLPYDVPLTPYSSSDSPFVMDFFKT